MRVYVNIYFLISQPKHMFKLKNKKTIAHDFMIILFLHILTNLMNWKANSKCINSFHTSGDLCYLLITFANSLDPEQD